MNFVAPVTGMVYYIDMSRELSIIILDKSDVSSEITRIYLDDIEGIKSAQIFNDFVSGYDECLKNIPDLVLIDVSDTLDFGLDIAEKLSQHNIPVGIMSVDNRSSIIIKALRSGAVEFLTKPLLKQDLQALITRLRYPQGEAKADCKIITLFSGKGGCGKTTIASNLALELAKHNNKKTALIDMNFCLGEVNSFLNLKNSFSLSNALGNIEKILPQDFYQMFDKYGSTELYVLSESPQGETFSNINHTKLTKFFRLLKDTFEYVVIDTPTIADDRVLKILQASDFLLYISAANHSTIKNSKLCIESMKKKGVNTEIKIILNRFVESNEITVEEIETELGYPIYKKIPNNYFTVMAAIDKGISVSEENVKSNVAESFRELAVMLSNSIIEDSLKSLRG